jgi:hypothetical protein
MCLNAPVLTKMGREHHSNVQPLQDGPESVALNDLLMKCHCEA